MNIIIPMLEFLSGISPDVCYVLTRSCVLVIGMIMIENIFKHILIWALAHVIMFSDSLYLYSDGALPSN